jgi:prefoldin subunit 5
MTISKKVIEAKKTELNESFKMLTDRINQIEKELGKLRSDANAVSGAIQVCDQLLNEADTKEMPEEKAQALNMATS